jgi:hypothetical protein
MIFLVCRFSNDAFALAAPRFILPAYYDEIYTGVGAFLSD